MGVSAINYTEMHYYFQLHGIDPEVEEVELIKVFDRVALNMMQEQSEKEQDKTKRKTEAAQHQNSKDSGP